MGVLARSYPSKTPEEIECSVFLSMSGICSMLSLPAVRWSVFACCAKRHVPFVLHFEVSWDVITLDWVKIRLGAGAGEHCSELVVG